MSDFDCDNIEMSLDPWSPKRSLDPDSTTDTRRAVATSRGIVMSSIVQKRRTFASVLAKMCLRPSNSKISCLSYIMMLITCSRRLYMHHVQ